MQKLQHSLCAWVIGAVLLSSTGMAQPLDPPDLLCVSVTPSGQATLTWTQPADPNGWFDSYKAFIATGQFNNYTSYFTTTAYGLTQFTGVQVPNSGPVFFYMQTYYDDGSGVQAVLTSDTLNTIFLNVSNSLDGGQSTGWAELDWNDYNSSTVTPQDHYLIYRRYASEPTFTLIDSTTYGTTHYFDDNKVCKDSVYYYVQITDPGCMSVSNLVGTVIEDAKEPAIPEIDSVSVDTATGRVLVGWSPSPSGETDGYIVFNFGSSPTPDTVWGQFSTMFFDTLVNANVGVEGFGVAVFDTCWVDGSPNTSPTDIIHSTMYLDTEVDACENTITLGWTPYEGWANGPDHYLIYAKEDTGAWRMVDVVNGAEVIYVHDSLLSNSTYSYFVRAVRSDGVTSTSNLVTTVLETPQLTQWHYLKRVTVRGGHPELFCYVDTAADISHYSIQRSTVEGGEYAEIGQIPAGSDEIISFYDREVNADSITWYYRVVVVDVCNRPAEVSNVANTILLAANIRQNIFDVNLNWNDYYGWDDLNTGISDFVVFRSLNGVFDDAPLTFLPSGELDYTDNVSDYYDQSGEVCYYLQAVEGFNNPFGFQDTSLSNAICVFAQPQIWAPSAFVPDGNGQNDVWRPVANFINVSEYSLVVFNKWGQSIFDSNDPYAGWDGTVGGAEIAQTGVYLWRMTFRDGSGEQISKTGHVTLIK